jgi:hypothetical protein
MSLSTMAPSPIPFPAGRSQKQKAVCTEWCAFVEVYRLAADSFREAAEALPYSPGPEFNQAWTRAERARKSLDEARTALLRHEYTHDCTSRSAS